MTAKKQLENTIHSLVTIGLITLEQTTLLKSGYDFLILRFSKRANILNYIILL